MFSKNGSAAAPAPAAQSKTLENVLLQAKTPKEFCAALSSTFGVRPTEVALLQLANGLLTFVYPDELKTAGSIPVSSSSAVAVHTVLTKKVELFNNFVKVKHVSVFETVKIGPPSEPRQDEQSPIQKLMSAPVTDSNQNVLGIVQVCRKGSELSQAGPDFTLDDLQNLEIAARLAAELDFFKTSARQ